MVITLGIERLSLVTLLFMYLHRLTTIIRYFGGCKMQLDSKCQVFFLLRRQDFCYRLLHSLHCLFLHVRGKGGCNI